jgi:hypothetical protein
MVNTRGHLINGRPRADNLIPILQTELQMQTGVHNLYVQIPNAIIDKIGESFKLYVKDPTIELISMTDAEPKVYGEQINGYQFYAFTNKGLPFRKIEGKAKSIHCVIHQVIGYKTGKIVFHTKQAMSKLNTW